MGKSFVKYLLFISGCFVFLFIVLSGNEKKSVNITNINNVKSLQAVHMVNKYNSIKESQKEKEIMIFNSFDEAIAKANSMPVAFIGKITAYGPDCPGCGGKGACPPRQDFRDGNIYFNDQDYGNIRVVAADKAIPCGSIVRITGINIYPEPILAVVLDRGGGVKGNHMDLLFTSQTKLDGFGTSRNIKFEIIRYGW